VKGWGVTEDEIATRLYAVVEVGEAALDRLMAAVSAAEIASLLITPQRGGTLDAGVVQPLVVAAQRQGVAALIADDARLARTLRTDGVHLSDLRDAAATYDEARSIVGRGGIVGVDAGISRHDSMTVAEAGADYVAFGAPIHLKDRDKARERRDELVAWWAEIFQAPCVALDVETPEEAEALARLQPDFVGVRLGTGMSPSEARDLVASIADAIRLPASAG
jgi:thiamine-phosphate pyrophosphorylase